MRSRRFFGGLSLLVLACACPTLASAEPLLDKVKQRGEMLVGTELQYAPFDFLQDGKQAGFNSELFSVVGKELGIKVRFLDLPWPSVLPGLDAEKFDMVAGPVSITPERQKRYAFTVPIAVSAFNLLKRKSDTSINKPEDIAGKVVGSTKGDQALDQLKILVAKLPEKTDIREYMDSSQENADLVAGRLAAVSNQSVNNFWAAKSRPAVFAVVPGTFGPVDHVAFVARKDDDSKSLLEAVDGVIRGMEKDGRLAALQTKWLGTAAPDGTAQ